MRSRLRRQRASSRSMVGRAIRARTGLSGIVIGCASSWELGITNYELLVIYHNRAPRRYDGFCGTRIAHIPGIIRRFTTERGIMSLVISAAQSESKPALRRLQG